MAKVTKYMSIVVNNVSEKKLPFVGNDWSELDEVLADPNCVGLTDIAGMKGKQFSVLGRVNYAQDLVERSKVRPVWTARLEGPVKGFATAAKATVRLATSLGKTISFETALAQVYAQMGIDPNQLPTVDKSVPVDYDSIGEEEAEAETENETEATV